MLRDFKGLDVNHEQAEGRIWSMAGIYHLNAPLRGSSGLNSEALKVGFYRVCHALMVFLFYMFFQDNDYVNFEFYFNFQKRLQEMSKC